MPIPFIRPDIAQQMREAVLQLKSVPAAALNATLRYALTGSGREDALRRLRAPSPDKPAFPIEALHGRCGFDWLEHHEELPIPVLQRYFELLADVNVRRASPEAPAELSRAVAADGLARLLRDGYIVGDKIGPLAVMPVSKAAEVLSMYGVTDGFMLIQFLGIGPAEFQEHLYPDHWLHGSGMREYAAHFPELWCKALRRDDMRGRMYALHCLRILELHLPAIVEAVVACATGSVAKVRESALNLMKVAPSVYEPALWGALAASEASVRSETIAAIEVCIKPVPVARLEARLQHERSARVTQRIERLLQQAPAIGAASAAESEPNTASSADGTSLADVPRMLGASARAALQDLLLIATESLDERRVATQVSLAALVAFVEGDDTAESVRVATRFSSPRPREMAALRRVAVAPDTTLVQVVRILISVGLIELRSPDRPNHELKPAGWFLLRSHCSARLPRPSLLHVRAALLAHGLDDVAIVQSLLERETEITGCSDAELTALLEATRARYEIALAVTPSQSAIAAYSDWGCELRKQRALELCRLLPRLDPPLHAAIAKIAWGSDVTLGASAGERQHRAQGNDTADNMHTFR